MDKKDEVQKSFSTFKLSYQNKTCSEYHQDVKKTKKTQRDRKTERLFSLVIQTKVVQNVTGCQKDRKTEIQTDRQKEDRKTFQLSYQNKSC